MQDTIFEAHREFLAETPIRNLNRFLGGPFWFTQENGDVRISGCYSYKKGAYLKKADLMTDVEDSILDIKKVKFEEREMAMIFWKDGWFGYTTTLHPIESTMV